MMMPENVTFKVRAFACFALYIQTEYDNIKQEKLIDIFYYW